MVFDLNYFQASDLHSKCVFTFIESDALLEILRCFGMLSGWRMYVKEELGGIMLTRPININIVLSV